MLVNRTRQVTYDETQAGLSALGRKFGDVFSFQAAVLLGCG